MNAISKINLITLNNLIHTIYTTSSIEDMEKQVLAEIQVLIDYDSGDFYLSSFENEKKLVSPITYNLSKKFAEDYLNSYRTQDYARGLLNGHSNIFRESDIIPNDQMIATEYYRKFYQSYDFHYSLHLSIAFNNHFLGVLSLYRKSNKVNFTYDEIETLNLLTIHLETRLYQEHQQNKSNQNKLIFEDTINKFNLTNRETSVVKLLLTDASNTGISDKLDISTNTLKKHISHIYHKLQINNRLQLINLFSR